MTAEEMTATATAEMPEETAGAAVAELPAEAPAEEHRKVSYDVDLDYNMEWEVETEPAVREPEPHETYEEPYYGRPVTGVARAWNKHIFTWVISYCLGIFGIDRFCRGQIGLGLLKMFTFGGFGFWYLADLAIAAYKSYGGEYRGMDDLLFDEYGRYIY